MTSAAGELVAEYGPMPCAMRGALDWMMEARPNICIKTEPLGARTAGYALRAFGQQRIVLNSRRGHVYPWVTLAHELGHLELGCLLDLAMLDAGGGWFERRMEQKANFFAAELLIPWFELAEARLWEVHQIAAKMQVPVWLVRMRKEVETARQIPTCLAR